MIEEIGVNLYNSLEYLAKYCVNHNCGECELRKHLENGDVECILESVHPCNLPIKKRYYINTEECTWKEEE